MLNRTSKEQTTKLKMKKMISTTKNSKRD